MKQEVNNFEKIYPLLNFQKEGDFYYIALILRKKDKTTTFGNKNNSARIIKTYNVYNLDYLKIKEQEIKTLCNVFGCRAGIYLNRRNDKEVAYEMNVRVSMRLQEKQYNFKGLYDTCVGKVKSDDKFWLLDCDSIEEYEKVKQVLSNESIKPIGNKIITTLPTYNGFHVVTNKFDRMTFDNLLGDTKIEIHKNNPFCLYYPENLEEN